MRIHVDLSGDLGLRQQSFVIACEDGRIEVDNGSGRCGSSAMGSGSGNRATRFAGSSMPASGARSSRLGSGKPPRCTLADGRAAVEAAIACHVSSRNNGAWVELPLTGAVREETFEFV